MRLLLWIYSFKSIIIVEFVYKVYVTAFQDSRMIPPINRSSDQEENIFMCVSLSVCVSLCVCVCVCVCEFVPVRVCEDLQTVWSVSA